MIACLSSFFGEWTNNKVKLLALEVCLHISAALELSQVIIEIDSMFVVQAIKRGAHTDWHKMYLIRRCSVLIGSFQLNHVFQQQNIFADALAT